MSLCLGTVQKFILLQCCNIMADKIIIRPPWGILCGPRAVVGGPRAVVGGPRAVVRGPLAVVRLDVTYIDKKGKKVKRTVY